MLIETGGTGLPTTTRLRRVEKPASEQDERRPLERLSNPLPLRGEYAHAERECGHRQDEVVLRPNCEARRDGRDPHACDTPSTRLPPSGCQKCECGEEEGDTRDVVVAAARLGRREHRGPHNGRNRNEREGRYSERTPDAPRGEQRDRKKGEVEDRREEVGAEEFDPERMQQRSGGGIERRQRSVVKEVYVGHHTGLREPSRRRKVVPDRVDTGTHTVVQRPNRARSPRRAEQRHNKHTSDYRSAVVRRRSRQFALTPGLGQRRRRPTRTPSPEHGGHTTRNHREQQWDDVEHVQRAEHL